MSSGTTGALGSWSVLRNSVLWRGSAHTVNHFQERRHTTLARLLVWGYPLWEGSCRPFRNVVNQVTWELAKPSYVGVASYTCFMLEVIVGCLHVANPQSEISHFLKVCFYFKDERN